jgi:CRP-like cAMP-binding protein
MKSTELSIDFKHFYEIPLIAKCNFSPHELSVFKNYVTTERFGKKEKILKPGEEDDKFRFIHKGLVRQYYIFDEKEINTQFCCVIDNIVVAFASYMGHQPSDYFIEALEPTTLFSITRENMDYLMSQGPNFINFGKSISAMLCNQKSLREKELLNYDALGRLQNFINTKPELFLRLPQIYIASYLNIQPETFSALKKKLVY